MERPQEPRTLSTAKIHTAATCSYSLYAITYPARGALEELETPTSSPSLGWVLLRSFRCIKIELWSRLGFCLFHDDFFGSTLDRLVRFAD
jgi:hypothetical protein